MKKVWMIMLLLMCFGLVGLAGSAGANQETVIATFSDLPDIIHLDYILTPDIILKTIDTSPSIAEPEKAATPIKIACSNCGVVSHRHGIGIRLMV